MAQRSYPFDIVVAGDRQVSAADHQTMLAALFGSSGVNQTIGGGLAASLPGGMFVQLATGMGLVVSSDLAYMYRNTSALNVAVTTADPTNPRIDILVLDLSTANREVTAKVVAGTPAGSPTAPVATSDQLLIATFDVLAAASAPSSLVDGRLFIPAIGADAIYVHKATTQTKNSDTTLGDDDELTFAVEANSVYLVEAFIEVGTNTTADWKFLWTTPSGSSIHGIVPERMFLIGSYQNREFSTGAVTLVYDSGTPIYHMRFWVKTSTTAGAVTLQWAQGTSDAGNTSVNDESVVVYKKVA